MGAAFVKSLCGAGCDVFGVAMGVGPLLFGGQVVVPVGVEVAVDADGTRCRWSRRENGRHRYRRSSVMPAGDTERAGLPVIARNGVLRRFRPGASRVVPGQRAA